MTTLLQNGNVITLLAFLLEYNETSCAIYLKYERNKYPLQAEIISTQPCLLFLVETELLVI